ncbi:DUF4232 domain-containing protein [Kitasatospora sp. NBC_01300]|uniref:DUF4232 domain-containing protein n=1 Tax=Kitasatospora sp. NBC_01300 TaxID=2903574 RepID=UPI002F918077|nr:DUF4232 domain-containing protein [Kitasatospora sp. NBC_01300]
MHQFENAGNHLTARRPTAAVAVVAVCATLLVGCADGTTGSSAASGSAGPCGEPLPSASRNGQASPGLAQGGVRITAAGAACAEYEVTNPGDETSDVTAVFSRLSAAGGALDNVTQVVTSLAPGATSKGRIELDGHGQARSGAGPLVKIVQVRSVPSAEASRPGGPCPASGLRLYADDGDAAMGLRAVGLHLRNCGTSAVSVNGYPKLQLLDVEHRPVDGVRFLSGGAGIAGGTGADDPPQEIVLRPGEGARSTLVWRNTVESGSPVNAPYVRVRATPDAAPVMVVPEIDLGTTGRLGVGAWAREDSRP